MDKKKLIYKDRFFIEDDYDGEDLNYFSTLIEKHGVEEEWEEDYLNISIGGNRYENKLDKSFNLSYEEDRQFALKYVCNLYIGFKNLYSKLQEVCKEIENKEKEV